MSFPDESFSQSEVDIDVGKDMKRFDNSLIYNFGQMYLDRHVLKGKAVSTNDICEMSESFYLYHNKGWRFKAVSISLSSE
jgi:hypothetical protein